MNSGMIQIAIAVAIDRPDNANAKLLAVLSSAALGGLPAPEAHPQNIE